MNPYFSIITPVFNQEKILERCVRSIQAQTDPDFEVLFVDDGSTDGSVQLLEMLTGRDPRFRMIRHPGNCSVLEARRTGLMNVTGSYVLFVDIDDFLDPDMLEILHKTLINDPVDILAFQLKDDNNGKVLFSPETEDRLRGLLTGEVLSSLMQYALSGNLIDKALPFIEPGYCNMAEDYYISSILMTFAESFGFVEQAPYHYVIGEGMSNSTSGLSMGKLQKQLSYIRFALSRMRSFLEENNPDYVPYLEKTRFIILSGTLWQYAGREVAWPDLFQYVNVFNNAEDIDVFNWACTELLPFRALLEQKAKKKGECGQ